MSGLYTYSDWLRLDDQFKTDIDIPEAKSGRNG